MNIAGKSLVSLRDHYRHYLFDQYLPFWQKHGIDHELGGFICGLDHDGTCVDDSKNMWYQGRGLWTYSYLYRHFGGEENLQVARQARDFILAHGRDDSGDWVTGLDRVGQVVSPATKRGYDGLFVAEGLQAYAHATGDKESLGIAIESLWRSLSFFDDPDRFIEEGYIPHNYPGMRILGTHMVLVLTLTQMLEQVEDAKLEALCDRVVDAIVNRYWHPDYRLMNEALDHDYQRPDDANEDFIYLGHAIETLWMLLPEAMRRKDRALFDLAAERFRRHLEVAWDDVYGGLFRAVNVHGAYTFDKVLWLQEEALVGCLILLEHAGLDWAGEWFARVFDYVEERFSLQSHGYPLYLYSGDRKVSYVEHVGRKEHYHHPRCVMRNLLALERMIERDGAVSDFWSRGGDRE